LPRSLTSKPVAVYRGDADKGKKIMQSLGELSEMMTGVSGKMEDCDAQNFASRPINLGTKRACHCPSLFFQSNLAGIKVTSRQRKITTRNRLS
jgi:hypothetical protein